MGYWLKSYTDILDDPKYFKLSSNAQLAMHECFLIAKKLETDELTGLLPSLEEIAFHSRKPIEFWTGAMKELIEVGIIVEKQPGYLIKNYVKRQQAIPDDERKRQWRKKVNDQRMNMNLPCRSDDRTECSDDGTNRDGEKRRVREEKSRERDREEVEVEKSTKNNDDNRLKELLLSAFASETGITAKNQSDIDALERLITVQATKNDLIGGIRYMQTNGYPIVGIKSVVNPTIVEMSKRTAKKRGPDDEDYEQYTKGKYGKFFKNQESSKTTEERRKNETN